MRRCKDTQSHTSWIYLHLFDTVHVITVSVALSLSPLATQVANQERRMFDIYLASFIFCTVIIRFEPDTSAAATFFQMLAVA